MLFTSVFSQFDSTVINVFRSNLIVFWCKMLIAEIAVVAAFDSLRLRVRHEIAFALQLRGIFRRQTTVLEGVKRLASVFVQILLDRSVTFRVGLSVTRTVHKGTAARVAVAPETRGGGGEMDEKE